VLVFQSVSNIFYNSYFRFIINLSDVSVFQELITKVLPKMFPQPPFSLETTFVMSEKET
jgi:hypothetical protein